MSFASYLTKFLHHLFCSMNKIKILDASGPPGLPSMLGGTLEMAMTTAISALSFSPDGEVPLMSLHALRNSDFFL